MVARRARPRRGCYHGLVSPPVPQDLAPLGRRLVLDELFDLALYRALRERTSGDLRVMLDDLIAIEERHARVWQRVFDTAVHRLDLGRRLKLGLLAAIGRVFGAPAIQLILEAIEIYGVRKYLTLWDRYRQHPLGEAVREVLTDELAHEDRVVSAAIARRIDAERVRNVVLGFNDGLVEILGAVSGFFAAFRGAPAILIAGATTAVAGALSMAAGAFTASHSEREVRRVEDGKRAFLARAAPDAVDPPTPVGAAVVVGGSYLLGALIPLLPVLLGARSIAVPLVVGGLASLAVSAILAFLSGMALGRRLLINGGLLAAAVAITYAIGLGAKALWGVDVR